MDWFLRALETTDIDEQPYQQYLSDAQYIAAFSAGIFSCTLSLFGSSSIIYLIFKTKSFKLLYHRIIFGLSIMDIVFTSAMFLQPFLLPTNTNFMFAAGNEQTCKLVAFFMQFFIAVYIYNAELSIYFLMTIRYGKSEEELSRKLEPYIHIVPIFVAVIFGILGVVLGIFKPSVLFSACKFNPSPDQADQKGIHWAHNIITILAILVALVCTWLIYWTVHRQTIRSSQWSFTEAMQREEKSRTRAVAVQAIWYTVVLMIGFGTLLLSSISSNIYASKYQGTGELAETPADAVHVSLYFLGWLLFPGERFVCFCVMYSSFD
jgi:hypothetical protein